ncbi:MAG: preprotein translocase subunit YajC [Halomonas sp.]|nr:preprotein translocase subunit YajC [Halomonas sp.]MDN6296529.1 preprotein translocase subunit YajC [Halomonas sp.]MDN6313882.1 preprotein translocase subunit YajC [Halomonas sp.]MDN6335336.1 preprotein translocase subunit YajC [Halomonas sp.]
MEWLIIGFIVLMVISPVVWLKPSPRQQRHTQLRAMARHKGVEVLRQEVPLHLIKEKMPAYRLRYPGEHPGPDFVLVRDGFASAALVRYTEGWRFRVAPLRPLPEAAQRQLQELITLLPDDVLMVQSSEVALTLWWWESGTAEHFAPCVEAAALLRDTLSGYADRPGVQPLAVPNVISRPR